MASGPTDDELEILLDKCETALSTVRRTTDARPHDLVAQVALPPLKGSLRHLVHDLRGWLGRSNDRPPPSVEHFILLRQFIRPSNLAIVQPQAEKIGLRVSKLRPPRRPGSHAFYGTPYILALFLAQGLAPGGLDGVQVSPPWIGSGWVPQTASLFTTYILVLQHRTSWIPRLCYLTTQGLCVCGWASCYILGTYSGCCCWPSQASLSASPSDRHSTRHAGWHILQ